MKIQEMNKRKRNDKGFVDPRTVNEKTMLLTPDEAERNLEMFLRKQLDRDEILFPYAQE